jgi:hypothetical protein
MMLVNVFEGATSAYSLRIPALSTYTGPLIRARRFSDNAELDFSAVTTPDSNGNRWLDTAAILTWVGAGSASVTTVYNQTGDGISLRQATAASQPRIATSGVISVKNGMPAMEFLGGQSLDGSAAVNISQPSTINIVASSAGAAKLVDGATASRQMIDANPLTGSVYRFFAGSPISSSAGSFVANDSAVISAVFNGASSTLRKNGAQIASGNTGVNALGIMRIGRSQAGSEFLTGAVQEVVAFRSELSISARFDLEKSQGLAFGITVA